jgi:hypothetical protein
MIKIEKHATVLISILSGSAYMERIKGLGKRRPFLAHISLA